MRPPKTHAHDIALGRALASAMDDPSPSHSCPEAAEFDRLRQGELSEPSAEALFEHLIRCEACDSLWRLLNDSKNDRPAAKPLSSPSSRPSRTFWSTGGWAVAAMLLVIWPTWHFVNSPEAPVVRYESSQAEEAVDFYAIHRLPPLLEKRNQVPSQDTLRKTLISIEPALAEKQFEHILLERVEGGQYLEIQLRAGVLHLSLIN